MASHTIKTSFFVPHLVVRSAPHEKPPLLICHVFWDSSDIIDGLKIRRCYFRAFQLELAILDTKNFEIGSVDTKLQPCEVGRFLENKGNFIIFGQISLIF